MSWHQPGSEPNEWSDVVVLVDPSLNGEGVDAEMPGWDEVVAMLKDRDIIGGSEHIAVRLTNLDFGEQSTATGAADCS